MNKRKTSNAAARARVLAQWRGVDLTSVEIGRSIPAKPANELVAGVLKEMRIDSRQSDVEIVKVWNALIDPAVTAHARRDPPA